MGVSRWCLARKGAGGTACICIVLGLPRESCDPCFKVELKGCWVCDGDNETIPVDYSWLLEKSMFGVKKEGTSRPLDTIHIEKATGVSV